MDDRQLARSFGLTRIAVGGAMTLLPGRASRVWLGAEAARPATQVVVRALGVRDLLLGVGLWRAANGGRSTKAWLAYGAVADATDGLAGLAGWRALPRSGRRVLVGMAAVAAAAGAALSARVD